MTVAPAIDSIRGTETAHGGWRELKRRMLAEMLGTGLLVVVDAGGAMISTMAPDLTPSARSAATAMTIVSLSYALSSVSGAHFNPSITLAFALRRVFPWKEVLPYWAAQVCGALAAAVMLRCLLGRMHELGSTHPHCPLLTAVVFEAVFTGMLAMVVLSTATKHRLIGAVAPLAAGGVILLADLICRPLSDASFNPARSLGPGLVSGQLSGLWIYLTAPLLGAVGAWGCTELIHPHRHSGESTVAAGEPTAPAAHPAQPERTPPA